MPVSGSKSILLILQPLVIGQCLNQIENRCIVERMQRIQREIPFFGMLNQITRRILPTIGSRSGG